MMKKQQENGSRNLFLKKEGTCCNNSNKDDLSSSFTYEFSGFNAYSRHANEQDTGPMY